MARFALTLVVLVLCVRGAARADTLGQVLYVAPDVYNGVQVPARDLDRAAALFERGRQAAEAGQASLALQLATETLHHDPNHAGARRVLGYVSVDGAWMTPHQAEQAARGYAWHSRYGWAKPEDLPRLEAGERPSGRRWLSPEVDQRKHATIEQGWQTRTDRFLVTTNHSPEAGVALAAELEGLFQVWRQLFAGYYLDAGEVRLRFAGERSARKQRRAMKVFYHRDPEGYVAHLRRRQPRIAETLGVYFDRVRQSHFFHADDSQQAAIARGTLYHEGAHQLFQETRPKGRSPGDNAHFWAIEGVACYFESLRPLPEGRYVIGAGGRLGSAVRLGAGVSLEELAAMGKDDFQRRSDLAALYAQSAACVTMLIHAEEGRDREAFVDYLRSIYGGRPESEELSRLLGRPWSEIDSDYRRFLERLDSERPGKSLPGE